MLNLQCDICERELKEPGALLFSPPIEQSWLVEKYHVCAQCWPKIVSLVPDTARTKMNQAIRDVPGKNADV